MDAKNIQFLVEKAKNDILQEVNDRLPRKVGITAVNHFRQNFRDAGCRDGGLRPWQRTRRQDSKSPDAKYTPLTSRRDHLMRSIEFQAQPGQVVISDPVPYAEIHNDGGDISTHPSVTTKLRKYAWHMVYSLAASQGKLPKTLPTEADKWKALALTKKTKLSIHAHIPQRQFIGDSQELTQKLNTIINNSLKTIKDGIIALANH